MSKKQSVQRRCIRLTTILILAAVLCLVRTAAARQIIFPPDGSVLEDSELEILGVVENESELLAWGTKGERQEQTLPKGYFTQSITLLPGKNLISLGDEWVNVFLPGEGAGSAPEGFNAPDLHAVDNSCDDCHVETGSGELQAEGAELCANCHDAVNAGDDGEPVSVQHPPVEDGECTSCHIFHGAAMSGLSGNDIAGLCYECHDDFSEEEGVSLHPVLEDDGCLDCHDPHGSSHGAILVTDSAELCFECHDNPAVNGEGEEWSTPHPALEDGCSTCHTPHGSAHGTLLLSEMQAVCGECHDDKNADDAGEAWGAPHSPVEEGECSACHLPHGSEEGALLMAAVPEICGECHDDMNAGDDGEEWPTPHPPVQDGECLSCHQPHGSVLAGMLTAVVPELCNECHDDKRFDDEGQVWETEHPPVTAGNCKGCHAPHGSAETAMLTASPVETCSRCHEAPHYNHLEFTGESEKIIIPENFPRSADGSFHCTGCHMPHGGSQLSLWRGDQLTLCTTCHRM